MPPHDVQSKPSPRNRINSSATELASHVYTDKTREKTTIAVTVVQNYITGGISFIVTSSSGGILPKPVREALRPGEISQEKGASGVDAEIKGLELAKQMPFTSVLAVGASRNVCSDCQAALNAAGVQYAPIKQ